MGYFVVCLPGTFQNVCNLDTEEKPPSTRLESFPSRPVQQLTDPSSPNSPPHSSSDIFPYYPPHRRRGESITCWSRNRRSGRLHGGGCIGAGPRGVGIAGKDIPVRGNRAKGMITLVQEPKVWALVLQGHGFKQVWLFPSSFHEPVAHSSLTHTHPPCCINSLLAAHAQLVSHSVCLVLNGCTNRFLHPTHGTWQKQSEHDLLAVKSWVSFLTFVILNFLICKVMILKILPYKDIIGIKKYRV